MIRVCKMSLPWGDLSMLDLMRMDAHAGSEFEFARARALAATLRTAGRRGTL